MVRWVVPKFESLLRREDVEWQVAISLASAKSQIQPFTAQIRWPQYKYLRPTPWLVVRIWRRAPPLDAKVSNGIAEMLGLRLP
jgi:hypothetical protein